MSASVTPCVNWAGGRAPIFSTEKSSSPRNRLRGRRRKRWHHAPRGDRAGHLTCSLACPKAMFAWLVGAARSWPTRLRPWRFAFLSHIACRKVLPPRTYLRAKRAIASSNSGLARSLPHRRSSSGQRKNAPSPCRVESRSENRGPQTPAKSDGQRYAVGRRHQSGRPKGGARGPRSLAQYLPGSGAQAFRSALDIPIAGTDRLGHAIARGLKADDRRGIESHFTGRAGFGCRTRDPRTTRTFALPMLGDLIALALDWRLPAITQAPSVPWFAVKRQVGSVDWHHIYDRLISSRPRKGDRQNARPRFQGARHRASRRPCRRTFRRARPGAWEATRTRPGVVRQRS